MMNKYRYLTALLSAASLLFLSCGEDRTHEYLEKTEVDNWIEAQMKEIYLYYQDMPQPEMRDYFSPPEEFFPQILASQDKYSYIEVPAEVKLRNNISSITYGFDFVLTQDPTGTSSRQVARVLQILPQSPAAESGLKRGDFIVQIDETNITSQNSSQLSNGNGAMLTVLPLIYREEDGLYEWGTDSLLLNLPPAISMENNPLYLSRVLEQNGQKIGYLVYNEFKSGVNTSDVTYMNQLLQVFQWFKQQNVSDFILDLRYNQGGQVACAQLLATLLAPAGCMGQEFARFEFNDKRQSDNYSLPFLTDYADCNLNLERLFIISGLYTASASEMMVNNLRPYMTVHLIGTQTEGKNVAMTRIESPYDFVMYPVTATVYNANGESDYSSGFVPEYIISELNYYPWYELGDPNELLLKNTLQWVAGGIPTDAENIEPAEEPDPSEEPETSENDSDNSPAEKKRTRRLTVRPNPGFSSIQQRSFPATILP